MKNNDIQKEKIRKRYQGISSKEFEVIPAKKTVDFFEDNSNKRVAVYVRVSTDDPRQTSSYELQKSYYSETISKNPNWQLVKIFADEGKSGTSTHNRRAFLEMIDYCKDGKIDLVITKSVSRFSRNVVDCLSYIRLLQELNPPVGVYFETEGFYTLRSENEFNLTFVATFAQEEVHIKSRSMNKSIDMRYGRGIFLIPTLLGFDHDEDGNLIINEEEAKTVRLIFFMYLYGYTCRQIAETLTKVGRKTKRQNEHWSEGTILSILQNERHCGDIHARKTFTPNYLNHKSKKNNNERDQFYCEDNHPSIISRADFLAVQHLISNAKYGNRGFLPEIKVVNTGVLKGFSIINPKWGGFCGDDYIKACESISDDIDEEKASNIEVQSGDFDFRGYEIARSQFFSSTQRISVTFSMEDLRFSAECINKMEQTSLVEMLINSKKSLFAVRPAGNNSRSAVKWRKMSGDVWQPRQISGTAFLKDIYNIFDWRTDCRYRVLGLFRQNADESLLIFNMQETEIFIPSEAVDPTYPQGINPMVSTPKTVCAYPNEWSTNFGYGFYRHAQIQELSSFAKTGEWHINTEGESTATDSLNTTSPQELEVYIMQLTGDIPAKEDTDE